MVANFFFGVGTMLVFGIVTTMLTEFMPNRASHGIALNNFVRNIFACVGSLVAEPLINAIGNGWLFTILGIWTLLSGPIVIWAMINFGDKWRKSSAERMAK
jgi:MFS family permease